MEAVEIVMIVILTKVGVDPDLGLIRHRDTRDQGTSAEIEIVVAIQDKRIEEVTIYPRPTRRDKPNKSSIDFAQQSAATRSISKPNYSKFSETCH